VFPERQAIYLHFNQKNRKRVLDILFLMIQDSAIEVLAIGLHGAFAPCTVACASKHRRRTFGEGGMSATDQREVPYAMVQQ
jgi:hypothetical protein